MSSSRRTTTTTTTSTRRGVSSKKAAPPPPPKPGSGGRRGSKKEEEVKKETARREDVRRTSSSSSSSTSSAPGGAAAAAAGAASEAAAGPASPRQKTPPREPAAASGARPAGEEVEGEESELDRELRKQMEQAEEDAKKIEQEIKERCQAAMDKRSRDLAVQFDYALSNTIKGMDDRYSGQLKGQIDTMQTDVLRTNKVFRDIGRDLGDEWPHIFRVLMKDMSPTVTEQEIDRIQAQCRPFMQPYNALLEWKRQMAEDFHMQPLIEALRTSNHYDLAAKAMDIMEARGENLMKLEGVGRGLASGSRGRPVTNGEGGIFPGEGASADGEGIDPNTPRMVSKKDVPTDPLSDAGLLKLARELGTGWPQVAQHIGLPEEDLETILANEGKDYSGGFRMLWVWRDSLDGADDAETNTKKLVKALHKAGFKDLASSLMGPR